jgi:Protein of unknown function (DUF3396)
MNEHYPRIRRHGPTPQGERLLLRELVSITFYLPHDHDALAAGVEQALDVYLGHVGQGPETICYWEDSEGEGDLFPLNDNGWDSIRRKLHPTTTYRFLDELDEQSAYFQRRIKKGFQTYVNLTGAPSSEDNVYGFTYCARLPWRSPSERSVSALIATLPTEYLEQHGPGRVRELALEMASPLRFSTGHAGLALAFLGSRSRLLPGIRDELFRHPGLDVHLGGLRTDIGTRVDGVHWLNFLGQPVLGELEGATGLRARLHSPGTTVQEMEGERALVTLGQWPEAGDLAQGRDLPAHRELARVLESWLDPFLTVHAYSWRGYTEEEVRRWWRRFLD